MGSVLEAQSQNSPKSSGPANCTTVQTPEPLESGLDPPRAATGTILHPPEILQTSPGRPGAATQRALNTPEILEMILVQVDMRTLLASGQRVCHAWTNLIRTSRSLQRALFFTPIREPEWATAEKTLNPLLAETFPGIFPANANDDDDDDDERFAYRGLPMAKDAETMNRFVRPNASWRRMLVQQPPLRDIGLFHILSTRIGLRVKRSTIPADTKHIMQGPGSGTSTSSSSRPSLRMERLFELLLFSNGGRSGRRIPGRVYWSTEEDIPCTADTRRIRHKFQKMIRECGVVVYSYEMKPCGKGWGYRPPRGPDEAMRRKILSVYAEEHLSDDDSGEVRHNSPWWDYDSGSYYDESDESDCDTYSEEEV